MSLIPKAFPNSSTGIKAEQSCSMLEEYLVKMGCDQIHKQYGIVDGQSTVMAMAFMINKVPYKLPVDPAATLSAMKSWGGVARHLLTKEQANRVAWRNLVDWVRSQAVFIKMGGASVDEVFMPYTAVGGTTLYRHVLTHGGVGGLLEFKP